MNTYDLNPRQRRAALLFLQGFSGQAIAKRIGVSPQTVSEWRQLADFQRFVDDQLDRMTSEVVIPLAALRAKAVESLEFQMTCGDPAVMLRAVQTALAITGDPRTLLHSAAGFEGD